MQPQTKKLKYRVAVFDLDGTLLDTLTDLYNSVNYALTSVRLPTRTKEEVRSFVGNGISLLMKRAIGEERADFADILQTFKTHYGEHCMDETKPYDGILPLLQALKNHGVQCAVLSNKADFAVKKLAKEYFGDLLQMAVGENEEKGIRKKPAPDSLFSVLDTLRVEKEQAVYIGDSEVDIQTAQNGGVDCISVTWGFKDRTFLVDNGGKVLVDTPQEILNLCIE